MAIHNKVDQNYCSWEDQRYRPGDVAIGGKVPLAHPASLSTNNDHVDGKFYLYIVRVQSISHEHTVTLTPDIYGLVINVSQDETKIVCLLMSSPQLHLVLFCGVSSNLILSMCNYLFDQMSFVVVRRFNFEGMLKSIVRHRISHLLCVSTRFKWPYTHGSLLIRSLVPPQVVLLCKVESATSNIMFIVET